MIQTHTINETQGKSCKVLIRTGDHLWRSVFECFEKIRKHSFIGDDWPLFEALCTIIVLIWEAKSMIAKETRKLGLCTLASLCSKDY